MSTYHTDNVYLASYLKTKSNINFVGIKPQDGSGDIDFHFQPENVAQVESANFLTNNAVANPKTLFNEFKDNKRMIINYKNTGQTVWVGSTTTCASNDPNTNTAVYRNDDGNLK